MVLIAAIIGLVGYNIINSIPELSTYIGSIADIDNQKQDVTGSSLSMRMEQLYGCFEEIDNSLLFGKGFGWTGYYTTLHGDHPIIEHITFLLPCIFLHYRRIWIYAIIYHILCPYARRGIAEL